MNSKFKTALELFLAFFKIGAFTFGGGYAMIPLIQREAVERKQWVTDEDILEIVAIAESTPGPIAVNAATFVGIQLAGFQGAILATIGAILPGCIIVLALSMLYRRYRSLTLVQGMMDGLRPVIVSTIFVAGFSILRTALFANGIMQLAALDWLSAFFFIAGFILLQKTHISAVGLILGTGAVGCVIRLLLGL